MRAHLRIRVLAATLATLLAFPVASAAPALAAGATHLLVATSASTPQQAGVAFDVTVTALDGADAVDETYAGTVHFAGGGLGASLPADYTFQEGDAGVHTFPGGVTLTAAGDRSIAVADNVDGSIGGSADVTVGPAPATTLVVSGYPGSTDVGVSHAFSVTAHDSYGNVATGYAGTVHFSSDDSAATLPGDYDFVPGDNGAHGFSAKFGTAGSHSLTASDTLVPSIQGSQSGIAVDKLPQAITFDPLPDRTYGDSPFVLDATTTSPLPVSFSATPSAVCTLSGDQLTLVGAGPCTVTASQGGNATWAEATPVHQTFEVLPRPITPHITAAGKPYDGTTGATITGRTLSGVLPGDVGNVTLTGGSAAFASRNAGTWTVTATGLALAGSVAGSYALTSTSATATADIAARPITVSAQPNTKAYDGTTSAAALPTITSGSLAAGDSATWSETYADPAVGTSKTLTPAGTVADGNSGASYAVTFVDDTTGVITARGLTVTGITAAGKTYDGTTAAILATGAAALVGVAGGDTVSLDTSAAVGTFADKNVANGKTVAVSGLSIAGADAANYSLAQPTTTANITPRSLSVLATGVDKVYDGTAAATVTLSSTQLAGDSVTPAHTAATFATPNVGSAIIVSVSGISLGGADAGNYSLVSTTASTTASITALSITPSIIASDKVYDGTAVATAVCSLSGVIVADVAHVTCGGTSAFDDKNVANAKTVIASGITLAGSAAGNYALASTTVTTTANVTPRPLSVTATGVDKVYDGTAAATVTLLSSPVPGDSVTLAHTAATFATPNVGSALTVSVSGISLGGADAGNYSLVSTTASTTASITARAVTVTADSKSRVYGDPDPALTYQVTSGGLVAGDAFSGSLARVTGEAVGSRAILRGTLGAGPNYAITFVPGTFTITKAELTAVANDRSRAFGALDPAFDAAFSGFKLGQTLGTSGITGSPACSTAATATSPVGAYAITCGPGTLASANYTFALPFTDGTLTVTSAGSTTSVTRSAATRTYGDVVTFTATIDPTGAGTATGNVTFREGALPLATVALDANGVATFSTSALGVGSHAVSADYSGDPNVTASTSAVAATVTVGKATLTVAADAASRSYGAVDPAFTATLTGFANGETLATSDVTGGATCTTNATQTSGVGPSYITCTAGTLASANYAFTFVQGILMITRAPLTVTANDATRQYGLDNPTTLGATLSGFALGQDATTAGVTGAAACSTTAQPADPVGSAPITCTGGTLDAANYAFTSFVPGTLTITPAVAAPVVAVDLNPSAASELVTFTATVTWPIGTPTGSVTFYEDSTALSDPLALVGGMAQFTTPAPGLPLGNHEITAVYSGDGASFAPATSVPFTQVVGTSAVNVALEANRTTWETGVPITFKATLVPVASHVTVAATGTVTFRVDGIVRATVPVALGTASYASPALAAGGHSVSATYAPDVPGAVFFTAGTAGTLTRTVVANTVAASGVGLSAASIFPYKDSWQDTVVVRGTRLEALAVSIAIYAPNGHKVLGTSIGRVSGAYALTWNGRTSRGAILPAGRYKVVQVLADAYGARRTYTSYVTLSTKRMYWYSAVITVSKGPRNFAAPGDRLVQAQFSTTSTSPLRIVPDAAAYGLGWTGVGYQFTLPAASTYRSASFQARAAWSGATAPKLGLIPWSAGNWTTSMYSSTRPRSTIGTVPASYYAQTLTNLVGIRSGRYIRAAIDSFEPPTGYGAKSFTYSITAVRLVVQYGILK